MVDGMNLVQFGQMLEQLTQLNAKLPNVETRIDAFERRIVEMEGRFKVGKGVVFGVVIGLGFAVYGIKTTLFKLAGLE